MQKIGSELKMNRSQTHTSVIITSAISNLKKMYVQIAFIFPNEKLTE